ncbi:MAG: glucose-6-phosphate dehydrogenase [Elusimicrobia bacterium]|nr:glucose-6-phosphate dehydrogenase [Elusimicrobiota bacterium]
MADSDPGRPAGPCAVVIFGASGDLTRRKLIPALYYLSAQGLLPPESAVIGAALEPMTHEAFRARVAEQTASFVEGLDERVLDGLAARCYYLAGDFSDAGLFTRLEALLAEVEARHKTGGNVLFYCATAPAFFGQVVEQAARAGLAREERGWRRFVIEKPFGTDLESAKALNARLLKAVSERQLFRIDHYLGKETVQNLLVLRFGNGIFEPVWNRNYVDHVQFTVAESLGVEGRGGYYDRAGALRDMVPSHIFQLLTLTAMEPPTSFEADAVRDEQVQVLTALQPLKPEEVLENTARGQYGEGEVDGVGVPGYRKEPSVAADSVTETFAALRLSVDNWRWAGVPFVLRTGKRLARHATEIVVQFKRVPHLMFRGVGAERAAPNQLVIRIQPDEGAALSFQAKVPGPAVRLGTVDMDFHYHDYFGQRPSTGYERLLHDAMLGDATLFQRADMVEGGWAAVTPILDVWKALPPRDFPDYPAGSWGPPEADRLLGAPWRRWRRCREP